MASGPHRPGFYLGVLVAGFIAGGFLTALLAAVPARERGPDVLHQHRDAGFGPVSADLLVINFTLGPDRAARLAVEPDRCPAGVPDRALALLGGPCGQPRLHAKSC